MNAEFKEKFKIPELSVVDFKHWVLSVRPQQITLGSMLISLKRDCNSLGELYADESKELNLIFHKTELLLNKNFQFDKINYLCLMMVDTHVHFHVIPRYADHVHFNGKRYYDKAWPKPPDLSYSLQEPKLAENVLAVLKESFKPAKNKVIGYTTGVFDLFHVGHLNILKAAKNKCDYLIVGVTTDELAAERKGKKPIIPFQERVDIIESVIYVDQVVPQYTMNKREALGKYNFDVMFVGDDWRGSERWNKLEAEFVELGVKILYFPYTKTTSSTLIRSVLEKININKH